MKTLPRRVVMAPVVQRVLPPVMPRPGGEPPKLSAAEMAAAIETFVNEVQLPERPWAK